MTEEIQRQALYLVQILTEQVCVYSNVSRFTSHCPESVDY